MAEMKKRKVISDDEMYTILRIFSSHPCFFKFSFRENN